MFLSPQAEGSEVTTSQTEEQPYSSNVAPHAYGWSDLTSAFLIVGANVLAVANLHLPFLEPTLGFWFIVIYPVYLLYSSSLWPVSSVAERAGYSVMAVLFLLMSGGLVINTLLPFLGIQRPLDRVPVVILGDVIVASLYILRRERSSKAIRRGQFKATTPEESRLIVASGLCVVLAVLGANRLNNGAGDRVTLMALALAVVVCIFLLCWRQQLREGIISVTLYLLSATLLLMTSLRGWYVTGHDIQKEYFVFQLTEAHGRWDISFFHDAYNACLSSTILPTEIAQIVHVYSPYVYKVLFQLIFALCPVLVYAIARRYWSKSYAILAALYFIGFPTFINDMPFLNRQEMSFLFVCVALLSITNIWWGPRRRRLVFIMAALGIELSHYSTMYVFLITLVVAWTVQQAMNYLRRRRSTGYGQRHRSTRPSWATVARTVGIGSILVAAGIAVAWGGVATKTSGSALADAESSVSGFISGSSSGGRSSDVAYSLFGGAKQSPQYLLNKYRLQTLQERAVSPSAFIPTSLVARYPTSATSLPPLPLTGIGHVLSDAGIPVPELNSAIRTAAANGEQVFVGIGLIALIAIRSFRRSVSREIFCLCVGSVSVVGLLTVLPDLSVDYGVLRAFQEALILIAPVLVVGSITLFRPFGKLLASRIAAIVCIAIFISTTGLLPQLTGGYPAQLNLNNSGAYYDIYYTHPQEEDALNWLSSQPDVASVLRDGVQAENFTYRLYFTNPSDITGEESIADFYPTRIYRSSWVVLSYSNVQTGQAAVDYGGDILGYSYPIALLHSVKDLVYSNGGAEIYK
jgi:uncharacterized membrane protein